MLLYITLGSNDLRRSKAFYDPVLAQVGLTCRMDEASEIGYGKIDLKPGERPCFLYVTKPFLEYPATWGNGTLVAFDAPTRASVDAFHAAGLAHGGKDDGAPGLRPYHANFYSCYLRDPDGNKISAVCERPA